MKVGLRSILWGVHAFWLHGFLVIRAWRKLYGRWPKWHEAVACLLHDCGYAFNCSTMDGPDGELHPEIGAEMVYAVVKFFGGPDLACEAARLSLYHSRYYAFKRGVAPSDLAFADKLCVLYEWEWCYLLRAKLSGEIREYRRNAENCVPLWLPDRQWLQWYKQKVVKQVAGRLPATEGHHIDGDNKTCV